MDILEISSVSPSVGGGIGLGYFQSKTKPPCHSTCEYFLMRALPVTAVTSSQLTNVMMISTSPCWALPRDEIDAVKLTTQPSCLPGKVRVGLKHAAGEVRPHF
jgi:hypothetical protein